MPFASYGFLSDREWQDKIQAADDLAYECALCPRRCGVRRLDGLRGFCGAPDKLIISSIFPHHGEEPPISGFSGSGTVFFSHCTLKCLFCQNFQISHLHEGEVYSEEQFARRLIELQDHGCHNINLVTASHFLPWLLRGLRKAFRLGLTIPIVYNCGGYESVSLISILKGIVDIYLPDMKYGYTTHAMQLSGVSDYIDVNQKSVREMFRQVGPLHMDSSGIAYRGIIIRHLVLPNGYAGSEEILSFLQKTFDPQDISISLMAQYHPCHQASAHEVLSKRIEPREYLPVKNAFINAGFDGYYQRVNNMDQSFLINFHERKDLPLTGRD